MEEFNILEFLKYYWSKILFVGLFIAIGLIGSYIYTFSTQVPVYQSQTSLVLTKNESNNNTITQTDISINKNLLSTYRQIIKSRRILETVIKNIYLDIDYETLSKQVEVSSVEDTELIVISVYNENNKLAKYIADEIANVFKNEIVEIYNIENVSIIDKALISDKPYNIHVLKQFIMGAGFGFIISSLIIAFFFFIDDSIKTEEDIETKIGLPVLGSVPKYEKKKR